MLRKNFTIYCMMALSLASTASAGEIRTIAGTGVKGNSEDGATAVSSPIGEPYGLVIGPDGCLYVCEIANHLIRRIDLKAGTMTVAVGAGAVGNSGDGGPAREALLNEPYEVRFDSHGNIFVVDMQNAVIRRVDARTGIVSTVAGNGTHGFFGDGGPATQALLNRPHSIALDRDDNLYICDISNHRVRRVDAVSGVITTFVGGGERVPAGDESSLADLKLNEPRALDFDGQGSFALALRGGNKIYRVDLSRQTLRHLAGTGEEGYLGDGQDARIALLSGPKGVAIAPNRDVYFADTESHTIRVVRAASGIIETVVGDGTRGDGPEGDPRHCRLARPHGVCVDASGNVYIGDSENHRVRVVKSN